MAGTAVSITKEFPTGSEVEELRLSLNKIVADLELLRAAIVAVATRLDGDGGVTGTTFVSADCAAINPATDLTGNLVNARQ